jgi:hypothetical protein
MAVQLAISTAEPGIDGLHSAVHDDPDLVLVDGTAGLDSVVELIADGGLDVALLGVDDPNAALTALSRLAGDGLCLPRTGIALTGSGAADLAFALRRLGLRAEAIDAESSPADICGLLARMAHRDGA